MKPLLLHADEEGVLCIICDVFHSSFVMRQRKENIFQAMRSRSPMPILQARAAPKVESSYARRAHGVLGQGLPRPADRLLQRRGAADG
jgi:hypothetical protein